MTYKEKIQELDKLIRMAPNNEAVKFICWRFSQNKYRGIHLLQHNRWTFEKFKAVIFAIIYAQNESGYIRIPRGDELKDFFRADYPQYDNLVNLFSNKYKEIIGKYEGTPNTIKKNLFPDLARMGVIKRYTKDKNNQIILLEPYTKKSVDFIQLNPILSLNKENIEDDTFLRELYNKASKDVYSNFPSLIFDLLIDEEIKGKIYQDEFLFFITWYEWDYMNKKMGFDEVKELILEWRKLNWSLRKEIVNFIKTWGNRENFSEYKKNEKRDYENLKNQTQEIMQHFKDSQLFLLNPDATQFEISFKVENDKIKRYRSSTPKKEYLKNHSVTKEKGFEFDHIVPFSWSTTWDEAIRICSWKNLIYIDGKSHSIKTQSNNIYVYLDSRSEIASIYLMSHNDADFLSLKLNTNVLFDMKLFEELKAYNVELNNFLSKNK